MTSKCQTDGGYQQQRFSLFSQSARQGEAIDQDTLTSLAPEPDEIMPFSAKEKWSIPVAYALSISANKIDYMAAIAPKAVSFAENLDLDRFKTEQ